AAAGVESGGSARSSTATTTVTFWAAACGRRAAITRRAAARWRRAALAAVSRVTVELAAPLAQLLEVGRRRLVLRVDGDHLLEQLLGLVVLALVHQQHREVAHRRQVTRLELQR